MPAIIEQVRVVEDPSSTEQIEGPSFSLGVRPHPLQTIDEHRGDRSVFARSNVASLQQAELTMGMLIVALKPNH